MSLRETDPDSSTSASDAVQPAAKKARAHGFAPDIRSRAPHTTLAHNGAADRTDHRQSASHRPASERSHRPAPAGIAPTVSLLASTRGVRDRMSLRETDPDSSTSASAAVPPAAKKARAHGFAPDIRSRAPYTTLARNGAADRTDPRQPASHRPSACSHRPAVCGTVCRSAKPILTRAPQRPPPLPRGPRRASCARWGGSKLRKKPGPTVSLRTSGPAHRIRRSHTTAQPIAPTC